MYPRHDLVRPGVVKREREQKKKQQKKQKQEEAVSCPVVVRVPWSCQGKVRWSLRLPRLVVFLRILIHNSKEHMLE